MQRYYKKRFDRETSKTKLALQAIYDDFRKLQSECHEKHREHLWKIRTHEMVTLGAAATLMKLFPYFNSAYACMGLLALTILVFIVIEVVDHARHKVHEEILVYNQNVLAVADDEYIQREYKYWASAWKEISFKEKVKATLKTFLGLQFICWNVLRIGILLFAWFLMNA